jgi:hypothetical protein
MVYSVAPSAVILVNADLTPNVQAAIQRQLYINDTITGTEFDLRIAADPNYVAVVHANGLRVLIVRDFTDVSNRDKFDIVLFAKAGLISVEINKFGAPGQTFSIDRCYLSQLFFTS